MNRLILIMQIYIQVLTFFMTTARKSLLNIEVLFYHSISHKERKKSNTQLGTYDVH